MNTIPRYEMWTKLPNCNINGNIFRLVQNLYEKSKSSVIKFPCQTGVRQGDNLSPLLFAIYLHDLEQFYKIHTMDLTHTVKYKSKTTYGMKWKTI